MSACGLNSSCEESLDSAFIQLAFNYQDKFSIESGTTSSASRQLDESIS